MSAIFWKKTQHFLVQIVPLPKAIVWEVCWRSFSSVFSFCKINGYYYRNCKFYRLCVRNPTPRLLKIVHKVEKWQWRHKWPTWRHRQSFFDGFLFLLLLVQASCQYHHWVKSYDNVFYKELIINQKTPPSELGIPNLTQMFLMKCYWML